MNVSVNMHLPNKNFKGINILLTEFIILNSSQMYLVTSLKLLHYRLSVYLIKGMQCNLQFQNANSTLICVFLN